MSNNIEFILFTSYQSFFDGLDGVGYSSQRIEYCFGKFKGFSRAFSKGHNKNPRCIFYLKKWKINKFENKIFCKKKNYNFIFYKFCFFKGRWANKRADIVFQGFSSFQALIKSVVKSKGEWKP